MRCGADHVPGDGALGQRVRAGIKVDRLALSSRGVLSHCARTAPRRAVSSRPLKGPYSPCKWEHKGYMYIYIMIYIYIYIYIYIRSTVNSR